MEKCIMFRRKKDTQYGIRKKVKVKVKQSRYRPAVAQRVPGS
jgi:hypothetical protein